MGQLLRLSPLVAQCLLNRGLREEAEMRTFLEPRLKQLSDPFLIPGMTEAVERLWQSRERGESLVIFGDYDVDGVTSTALLLETLRAFGWKTEHYLPHRMEEGYGLSGEAVDRCVAKFPAKLLVAVDCGSSSHEVIARLKSNGVDVLVIDHHQTTGILPDAVLINPHATATKQELAENFNGHAAKRFQEFCSVGLCFKLAHALVKRGREAGLAAEANFDLRPLLDLVALGTIADLVPLTGENRVLVSVGLDRLNDTARPGLIALKRIAQCPPCIGVREVGFQLGPRLNAAGRLEDAEKALRLLRAEHLSEALVLAHDLDANNTERQKIQREITERAVAMVEAAFQAEKDFVIVTGEDHWHPGVVGIVASHLTQRFYRPSIVMGSDGVAWRGSGRSIAGFDLAAALRECGEDLLRHGGHAMAAGITIEKENVDRFRERLNAIARARLNPELLQAPLRLDAEVGLEEMSLDCLSTLDKLHPMGQGNPTIQFFARNVTHSRPLQKIGNERQHVKMWVTDGTTTHEAIWWRAANESLPVGRFDLAFAPQTNSFNGRTLVQLKVLDWRAAEPAKLL
jgi:single-stranded-DNA-specific exonuclease